MMYYNIRLDWNPKVIGVKNGIYQVELDKKSYNRKTYSSLEKRFIGGELMPNQEVSDVDFKFNFKWLKSAKRTSFLSFSPVLNHCHFLIEKSIFDSLISYNIQSFYSFEAIIRDSMTNDFDDSFCLFYCAFQDWDMIDFRNTVFTSGGFGKMPIVEHSFVDQNEMLQFKGLPKVKTLSFKKEFDESLDLFHTRLGGVFISEKLKQSLEKNKATGLIFNDDINIVLS